jgi:hypothetical protein
MTVTGSWEKNNAARIPFTIDDFQGFRYLNLSYQMLNPTAATPGACGLVIKLTTDAYFAQWKNGSNLVFVPVGEDLKVFNTGFITFDPRTNPEPSWQNGRYWILVNMNPSNCVNEVHLRLDLVRESGEAPVTPATATVITSALANQPATSPQPSPSVSQPGGTVSGQAPVSSAPAPTKTPLQPYLATIAGTMAISIYAFRFEKP